MAKKKIEMCDEEIALRIIRLYFEEIARIGLKRTLTLDSILNTYFYTLYKLKNKEKEMSRVCRLIEEGLSEEATKEQKSQQ
ncbi:MAG: hypothetical protein QXM75_01710 [Candidatus Diapherotrites archaeon]